MQYYHIRNKKETLLAEIKKDPNLKNQLKLEDRILLRTDLTKYEKDLDPHIFAEMSELTMEQRFRLSYRKKGESMAMDTEGIVHKMFRHELPQWALLGRDSLNSNAGNDVSYGLSQTNDFSTELEEEEVSHSTVLL